MLVWHFVNSDGGGAARFLERLVRAQVEQGGLAVRAAGSPALSLPPAVARDPYEPYRAIWGLNQWRFALHAWRLMRRARTPALIHAHSFLFTAPDVYTVHGLYTQYSRSLAAREAMPRSPMKHLQFALLSRLERRMLGRARRVAFPSEASREYVEGELGIRRPEHFRLIPPGVDASHYSPRLRADLLASRQAIFPEIEPRDRWLLFVGNDFRGKGLLRILGHLVKRDGRWRLLAFGRDPVNARAARLLQRARPEQIHIFDDDSRLLAAYGLSDLLVMDSVSEGFPLVLLEAMASGCVPAVTRFGGVTTGITDGVDGLVLDSAAGIVETALSVEGSRLRALASQAVDSAGRRSWHHVAAEYRALYDELS
jgi:glycosyltransferase involved in cell wall biosynthesis